MELVGLDVEDLRCQWADQLSIRVRNGKGNKSRYVPYGALDWCLTVVDKWLEMAEVTSGAVFHGFYKGYSIRPERVSPRTISYMLDQYPISIDGELTDVPAHSLRRTYASLQDDAGMRLTAIQQNLGHESVETTIGYIGPKNGDQRRGRAILSYDLGRLT